MTSKQIIAAYVAKDIPCTHTANLIVVPVTSDQLVAHFTEFYVAHRLPLKTIKAIDDRTKDGTYTILYVFAVPASDDFLALSLSVADGEAFPSLIAITQEVSLYEREIQSFFGLVATGHPDPRPFILHENWPATMHPLRKDFAWNKRPKTAHEPYPFHEVRGEGIYEIPVGPIHAGIIEPGHFRFSVAGEEIMRLEPQLGYVHKGSEKLFERVSLEVQCRLAEHISGDMSFSHALAFCQAVEYLGNVTVPERSAYLRVIYSELERLANHCNDIGFILNDTAFTFGGSNGTRLREQVMQLCERLIGHRFLRGVACVGGVTKDLSATSALSMLEELIWLRKDLQEFVDITADSETVANRLHTTGILTRQVARDHGVVGIAARASGLRRDARIEHPYDAYNALPLKMVRETDGDVYARYQVRVREAFASLELIRNALTTLPSGPIRAAFTGTLEPSAYAIGITEGWRGDIVYLVATDAAGAISRVGVRDPSFLNWPAVPFAVVGNIVPDFPLINKSFNLSYSGFDR